MHCSGYKTAPNMSNYFGRIYQARYLTGLVAGSMTQSNVIGYVAAFPPPKSSAASMRLPSACAP